MGRTIVAKEEQIKNIDQQYQTQTALLKDTTNKLDTTMSELEEKRAELTEALDDLKDLRQQLIEQTVLTEAHAGTEKALNELALSMKETLHSSVDDIHNLHEKLGMFPF